MQITPRPPLSLTDRLACALVSLAAAIASCAIFGIAIFLRGGWELEFWSRSVIAATGLVAGAAILGFVLGPDRMANAFGILWGTEEPNGRQAFFLVLLVFSVLAVVFWL